jgi:hypothetical protein
MVPAVPSSSTTALAGKTKDHAAAARLRKRVGEYNIRSSPMLSDECTEITILLT